MTHPCGRLAPSPTGYLHIGNAWAFFLAWVVARQSGARLVLRFEDIDPDRSRPEYERAMLDDLQWLGIDWDADPRAGQSDGIWRQSVRQAVYAEALAGLARRDLIYPCYCSRRELRALASAPHAATPPYPGLCRGLSRQRRRELIAMGRRPAMRLCTAGAAGCFDDFWYGTQFWNLEQEGGDCALRRSDGVVAYQLAVVVDDIAAGVTQVVRGDDLLGATGRQIWLYQLFDAPAPRYWHLPLVLDCQGERLAKRHAGLELRRLRQAGVRPEALLGDLCWRSGLLEAPARLNASELCERIELAQLSGKPVILPEEEVYMRELQGDEVRFR